MTYKTRLLPGGNRQHLPKNLNRAGLVVRRSTVRFLQAAYLPKTLIDAAASRARHTIRRCYLHGTRASKSRPNGGRHHARQRVMKIRICTISAVALLLTASQISGASAGGSVTVSGSLTASAQCTISLKVRNPVPYAQYGIFWMVSDDKTDIPSLEGPAPVTFSVSSPGTFSEILSEPGYDDWSVSNGSYFIVRLATTANGGSSYSEVDRAISRNRCK